MLDINERFKGLQMRLSCGVWCAVKDNKILEMPSPFTTPCPLPYLPRHQDVALCLFSGSLILEVLLLLQWSSFPLLHSFQ